MSRPVDMLKDNKSWWLFNVMDINIVMGDDCHSAGVCGDGLWIRVYMGRSVIILIMFLKNF